MAADLLEDTDSSISEIAAHLGYEDKSSQFAELIVNAREVTTSEPAICQSLRALLRERLDDITPDEAARVLKVSVRTLQRRLQMYGTSWQVELEQARMQRAKTWLANSDRSITDIALSLGYRTSQHFAKAFRTIWASRAEQPAIFLPIRCHRHAGPHNCPSKHGSELCRRRCRRAHG